MRANALRFMLASLFLLWSGVSLSFVITPSSPTIEVGETVTFSVAPESGDGYDFAQLVSMSLNINYDSAVLLPLYATISQLGVDSGLPGSADPFNYFFYNDPDVLGVDFSPTAFPLATDLSSGELVHFTLRHWLSARRWFRWMASAGRDSVSLDWAIPALRSRIRTILTRQMSRSPPRQR